MSDDHGHLPFRFKRHRLRPGKGTKDEAQTALIFILLAVVLIWVTYIVAVYSVRPHWERLFPAAPRSAVDDFIHGDSQGERQLTTSFVTFYGV